MFFNNMDDYYKEDETNVDNSIGKLILAVVGGAIGAIIGTGLLLAFERMFEFRIMYLTIALGFLTAFFTNLLGSKTDERNHVIAAVFSGIGCLMVYTLALYVGIMTYNEIGFFELYPLLDFKVFFKEVFGSLELFEYAFIALSISTAYKTSIRIQRPKSDVTSGSQEVKSSEEIL